MIIQDTGKICDNFYMVGTKDAPVYLLDGPMPVIFDSGLAAATYRYEQDLKSILGKRSPAYLLLTHSHFDHIGASGYFKQLWPEMKIAGSSKCATILKKPKAVQLMKDLSKEAEKEALGSGFENICKDGFIPFEPDLALEDNQTIDIGDQGFIHAMNCPGHTWDFMAYWIPDQKIMVASESVPVYERGDYIQPEFLVDVDAYLASMDKIKKLAPRILCTGHYAVFTEKDVTVFLEDSVAATQEYVKMASDFLKEEKMDIEKATMKIKAKEWDPRPWPKQPESAYLLNTFQRVKTIAGLLNKS